MRRAALCVLSLVLVSALSTSTRAQDTTPPASSAATWYEPMALDPKLPRQRERPPKVNMLGLVYDGQAFVNGRVDGTGQELRLAYASRHFGVTLGVHLPDTRIGVGFDVGRNWGIPIGRLGGAELAYLLPTVEARAYFRWDFVTTPVLALGSSLAGLRASVGRVAFDVRLPRVDLWGDPNSRGSVALSVGASVSALMSF